jgi:5-methylcytosine-specific restriction protein A
MYKSKRWAGVRRTVLRRDHYLCQVCGQPADTVDHISAMEDGGDRWALDNLRATCRGCNARKALKERSDRARRRRDDQ